ncbi:MAG: aspartate carbamoyltransferase regulatory subunit [Promethearchaeota archaeon]|nr:MAG: aspartate carbamoyltransferase regulatory subunit [Candidatus Lokiarchaeota archaeon]
MSEQKLKIDKIRKGTVIDHVNAGYALLILNLTGLDETPNLMTIGVNVSSKKYGKKDIIKIENVFLDDVQIQQIAILSSNATISLIKDFKVIRKKNVEIPKIIKNIIICDTKTCISNSKKEPIDTEFIVLEKKPLKVQCAYCDRIYKLDQIKFKTRRKRDKRVQQTIQL